MKWFRRADSAALHSPTGKMEWRKLAGELVEKIRSYREQADDWKIVKETKDVTVWSKPSAEYKGTIYKTVGEIEAEPETVFRFIDPSGSPDCPRNKWDTSIVDRRIVEDVEENIKVMHTITRSGLGGLISSRDFVDLLVIEKNDEFLGTVGTHSGLRLVSLIQTDLGGMLPHALVEQALPSSQLQFFSSLKDALKDAGHLRDT